MKTTGLRAWLVVVAACVAVGVLVGAIALAVRPATYTTTATTSVVPDPQETDPSLLQGLTATIFMMMPVYADHAQDPQVVDAAAAASGLSADEVRGGLQVERTIDSSLLRWSFTAPDPGQAAIALDAATATFSESLPDTGPQSTTGEDLLTVTATPASPATAGPLTPLVGAAAGGAIGLLGALAAMLLLYRGRSTSTSDWDEVENVLGIPVAADLVGRESDRARQWRYVADRLQPVAGEGPVGLYGLTTPVADADVTALRIALRRADNLSPQVAPDGPVNQSDGLENSGLAGAVVIVDTRRLMESSASDCRAIAHGVAGPVVAVLDRRHDRQR